MTKHPQQEQITNTEWIIDLEKFDNRIEKYVSKDTFCTFSSMDLKDTLDEIRTIVYNCIERRERSRPHPAQQAPMPNDYRELFIRDMLYNFRWTAEHGNPEFFKAVDMIKREYLKPESQLLAEHDAAIAEQARKQERKRVLDELVKYLDEQVKEWPDEEVYFDTTLEEIKDYINEFLRGGA